MEHYSVWLLKIKGTNAMLINQSPIPVRLATLSKLSLHDITLYLDKRRGAYTMIDKRLRNEIVQRILMISAVSTLHFDKFNPRHIKFGSKCSLGCPRGDL
jgi:hypothetical protein